MQSKKLRRSLPYVLVVLYTVLLLFQLMQIRYIQGNQEITVRSQPDSGTVTFRGAMIDGNWYGASQVTVSSAGWVLQEKEDVLTDTEGNMLELKLPSGAERVLIFNIGPNEGIVHVSVNRNTLEWNLYSEEAIDYGGSFQLPYVHFSNKVKLSIAALSILALSAVVMLTFNFYFRKKNPRYEGIRQEKNPAIEFLRFFIIMSVVLHHFFWYSSAGYLGVDFFFLLSGFLLMSYYTRTAVENEEPALAAVKYTKKRFMRLFPYYLLAFFLGLGISACLWEGRTLDCVTDAFWELLMLEAFGFTENLIVGPGWYCSALIIAGLFVYYLLAKNKKTYLYIIAPLSLFVIFAWMQHKIGHLNRWLQVDTLISTGTLRGFADMGLGCISYHIYDNLCTKNWGSKILSTILEMACFSYIVYVIYAIGSSKRDFVCVFVMATLIISLFLRKSLWSQILNNRLSRYLGSISIGVYLNHAALEKIYWHEVGSCFGLSWNAELTIYLVVVVVFSAISTKFVENIVRICRTAE